jgi:hypothetical protein
MRQCLRVATASVCFAQLACDKPKVEPASITTAPEWHLSAQPRVSIGVAEGDDRYMFQRVNGVMLAPNGSIFVSDDGREPSVTLYDSAGQFIKRVGKKGSGPGEFHFPRSPFMYRGDSVAVWDFGQRRISIFGIAGQFARTLNVVVPPRSRTSLASESHTCCRLVHSLTDGSFVLEYPSIIPKHPGPVRHALLTLARIGADGTTADFIGTFRDRQYRYDAGVSYLTPQLHMSWSFQYAVVGDTVFGGNGEGQWLIRQVPGSPPDTVRFPGVSIAVTDSIKALYAQAYREEFRRNPRHFEGPVEEMFEGAYADSVPAYTQVRSDNAGHLWLAQWTPPYSRDPLMFHVYSTAGKPVARIELPARTWVLHVSRDHVTVVEYDADDVQYVRVYDIIRPAR